MVEVFDPANDNLEVTQAAAKHFKKHLDKDCKIVGIYIGTKATGCSGLTYDIAFVEQQPENTTTLKQGELKFFVSNESKMLLNGLKIDYVKHEFGLYKLQYTNPNESGRCGCGESFTV